MNHKTLQYLMDEAFVLVSVISGIFGLIGLELISHNWFKKERFKFEVFNLKKRQDLELKKMARDMGLTSTPPPHTKSTAAFGDNIGGLLDLAKGLPPESLGAIADIIQGRLGGGEGEGEIVPEGMEGLIDFAVKNPDIVKSFMGGMNKGKEGGGDGFI
jgi:hypothetical protein